MGIIQLTQPVRNHFFNVYVSGFQVKQGIVSVHPYISNHPQAVEIQWKSKNMFWCRSSTPTKKKLLDHANRTNISEKFEFDVPTKVVTAWNGVVQSQNLKAYTNNDESQKKCQNVTTSGEATLDWLKVLGQTKSFQMVI